MYTSVLSSNNTWARVEMLVIKQRARRASCLITSISTTAHVLLDDKIQVCIYYFDSNTSIYLQFAKTRRFYFPRVRIIEPYYVTPARACFIG